MYNQMTASSKASHRWFQTGLWIALLLLMVILIPGSNTAQALPNEPEADGNPPGCSPKASAVVTLQRNGLPLIGSDVQFVANASLAVSGLEPKPCDVDYRMLPAGQRKWEIVGRPANSTASLGGTSTLQTTLRPDRVGKYTIRFTACPDGCSIPRPGGTLSISSVAKELSISAVDELTLPPETEPEFPQQTATAPAQIDNQCPRFADKFNAAWLTVKPWHGPDDYELLEGRVASSGVSNTDNDFNHHSMDVNIDIDPYPSYRRLLKADLKLGQSVMEVEWERSYFPEDFWPTAGDRVSVVGYWIYDCGHDAKTEIHPPVMLAVHRSRAIQIPSSAGFGSNVYVPGIVTDIWISSEAGGVTDDCSRTGLHQQGGGGGADLGPHACLPQTEGFSRNPINRVYEFNIYLPRNPQVVLTELGKDVPSVPLYHEILNPWGGGGPDPIIEESRDGDITFLKVRLDLSAFRSQAYSRRIVSGWAYASPDNWDLKRWKLRVTQLDVTDDGDPIGSGDGDWRFWVNTVNTEQEWTKLFDCDGCVTGVEDFGGRPWETGSADPNRSLGPDLLLYPDQDILLHTSGFEDDAFWEESIGGIRELLSQARQNDTVSSADGDATFDLSYQIEEGRAVGNANLSPAAQAVYDAYTLTSEHDDSIVAKLKSRLQRQWNHPRELILSDERPTVRLSETEFAEESETEPLALDDISLQQFREDIAAARETSPDLLDSMMTQLREQTEQALEIYPVSEVKTNLASYRKALPDDLWSNYFGDLRLDDPNAGNMWPMAWLVATGWLALVLLVLLAASLLFYLWRKRNKRMT